MDREFLKSMGVSLDLALEAREIVRGETGQEVPGVRVDKETYDHASVTTVYIEDESAQAIMGKPVGKYITIEAPVIRENDPDAHRQVAEVLAEQLKKMFDLPMEANILVVGLGNWNATPDALGPRVVDNCLVTRHLFNYAPQSLQGGMRPVSAIAPGVLGITGIETAEIVQGVTGRVKPELIIAIDSLAARSVDRIATTIQLADTGINPGSGIGNKRAGINQETMGVKVIAIGVPTVASAALIAQDAIEKYLKNTNAQAGVTNEAIKSVLEPFGGNLTVTPKEIDTLIEDTAHIIAGGISMALHPEVNPDDYAYYLH
ncbi:spore protease [Desulfotomaculum arcticum]|uniref:Germination protease n=1 Tax=Desulfotruncus arcticus DSM 17038 TaxID=1121424 RepID=A0A1I2RHH7_9FIRM|nr:GPR endopeptidase [Desulfotruncus arcticus]SFG38949.1 spore protease [Desulfotomaculum arcticum] [Desulfotruncus arcticus DSM 17038]